MELQIHRATAADMEDLVRMRFAYLQIEYDEMEPERARQVEQSMRAYFAKALPTGDFVGLFGKVTGQIVATAYATIATRAANPLWVNGRVGTVLNVMTLPEYRHQGIATRLMQELIAIAKEQEVSHLELSASEQGRPLYEKLGFGVSHFTFMGLDLV